MTYSAGTVNGAQGAQSIVVTLTTPMLNTNYSVSITDASPGATFAAAPVFSVAAGSQTTTSFTINIRTINAGADGATDAGGVNLDWIAIEDQ